jgi:hypothetical protein
MSNKRFGGFNQLLDFQDKLRSLTINTSWLNEFQPIDYDKKRFIHDLLAHLWILKICCAFVGLFPAYTARVFRSYGGIAILAIAVTDSHLWTKFCKELIVPVLLSDLIHFGFFRLKPFMVQ